MFDFLTLPERTTKPRESGLTHVLDKGHSLEQVRQFMEVAQGYVDIVKLGWGTAAVTPNLREKVELYQSYGIPVCFGGTFFELCLRQNRLEEYLAVLRALGMDCLEISDGTVAMEEDDKLALLLCQDVREGEPGCEMELLLLAAGNAVEADAQRRYPGQFYQIALLTRLSGFFCLDSSGFFGCLTRYLTEVL